MRFPPHAPNLYPLLAWKHSRPLAVLLGVPPPLRPRLSYHSKKLTRPTQCSLVVLILLNHFCLAFSVIYRFRFSSRRSVVAFQKTALLCYLLGNGSWFKQTALPYGETVFRVSLFKHSPIRRTTSFLLSFLGPVGYGIYNNPSLTKFWFFFSPFFLPCFVL